LNHPIVRLFGTAQQAADAIAKLKKEGYTDDLITLVSPAAHQGKDAIASAIAAGYVLKSLAVEYAEGVLKGHSLVIVRAPFGAGGKTEKILDSAQPIDSGVSIPADRAALWDEAAPISSALKIPVLSQGLFSTFWTLPVLTRWNFRLPIPELTNSSHSTTALSHHATPLSSLLHIPLLTRR
jgi:hypothetical protein